ncbi:ATP-dependent zinc protease [Thiospirillum jenense]|uniref:ATP-dependent zinc protease n=1 Tax=Thiospirillum jenense TaxID=1653858 RepID=A0A839HD43_9GAMM|nr:ATP-dependent zinc protease [Thiospirillum jenense]
MKTPSPQSPVILGWREWVGLPDLDIPLIKAKLDSGAHTSALHAEAAGLITLAPDKQLICFAVQPLKTHPERSVQCIAPLIDRRMITNSGGHGEQRYVIRTHLRIGALLWAIELSLTNRATMRFRMLLGRTALAGRALIDVRQSYLMGRPHLL